VLFPNIDARVEEPDNLTSCGIEAGYVRSFVAIAVSTSQRQVVFNSLAPVLLGTDVVNLKRQRKRGLREATVLATVSRSFPDRPRELLVHCWRLSRRRALDCMTAKRLPTCR
jgi:hypothetical protein